VAGKGNAMAESSQKRLRLLEAYLALPRAAHYEDFMQRGAAAAISQVLPRDRRG
jgi:hypothetical protein